MKQNKTNELLVVRKEDQTSEAQFTVQFIRLDLFWFGIWLPVQCPVFSVVVAWVGCFVLFSGSIEHSKRRKEGCIKFRKQTNVNDEKTLFVVGFIHVEYSSSKENAENPSSLLMMGIHEKSGGSFV